MLGFLASGAVNRFLPHPANPVSSSRHCSERGSHVLLRRRKASVSISLNRKDLQPQASTGSFNHAVGPVVLVVDHGSRRKEANEMLSEVGEMLQGKTELPVYTAHMELASPSIADGVDKCVKEGATHIIVVPFFLSPGRHSTKDIPQMTADAVANHPGVTFDIRPPIGTHPGIIDVILDRAGLLGSVQK